MPLLNLEEAVPYYEKQIQRLEEMKEMITNANFEKPEDNDLLSQTDEQIADLIKLKERIQIIHDRQTKKHADK